MKKSSHPARMERCSRIGRQEDLMQTGNLFDGSAAPATGETFDVLLAHRNLVVERIVSSDGPKGATFEQPQDEWVLLIRGTAVLQVDGRRVELTAGDYLFIAAGVPHTVEETSGGALWLAVHLHSPAAGETPVQ
jgi:cupin 2 domain-containing protein